MPLEAKRPQREVITSGGGKCDVNASISLEQPPRRAGRAKSVAVIGHEPAMMEDVAAFASNPLVQLSPDLITIDAGLPGQRILFASDAARQFGYEPSELVGKTPLDFMHPEDVCAYEKALAMFKKGVPPYKSTWRWRRKNWTYSWTESSLVTFGEQGMLLGTVRDITDRVSQTQRAFAENHRTAERRERRLEYQLDVAQGELRTVLWEYVAPVDAAGILPPTQGEPTSTNLKDREKLGQGSFATVTMAVDETTGEKVAMKRIDKEAVTSVSALRNIAIEITALRRLGCHARITKLLDVLHTNSYVTLVLEHGGVSLVEFCNGWVHYRPPTPVVWQVAADLFDGLAYCHAKGVVHRDIKVGPSCRSSCRGRSEKGLVLSGRGAHASGNRRSRWCTLPSPQPPLGPLSPSGDTRTPAAISATAVRPTDVVDSHAMDVRLVGPLRRRGADGVRRGVAGERSLLDRGE